MLYVITEAKQTVQKGKPHVDIRNLKQQSVAT